MSPRAREELKIGAIKLAVALVSGVVAMAAILALMALANRWGLLPTYQIDCAKLPSKGSE